MSRKSATRTAMVALAVLFGGCSRDEAAVLVAIEKVIGG